MELKVEIVFAEESCQFRAIYKRKTAPYAFISYSGVSSNSICGYVVNKSGNNEPYISMYYCSADFLQYPQTIFLGMMKIFLLARRNNIGELIYCHESFCPLRWCSQLHTGSLL